MPASPADEQLTDFDPPTRPSAGRIVWRVLLLLVAAIALYGLAPQLLDVAGQVPELRRIRWPWFIAMLVLQTASLACLWQLIRIALPGVTWFVAATSQLSANAVTKSVPGGAAVGAALSYRMLSVSGVVPSSAVSALTATGLLTTWVLFALPFFALVVSLLGSPVPKGMTAVAWGGAALFLLMFAGGVVIVRTTRPLEILGGAVERSVRWIQARFGRESGVTAEGLVRQRNEIVTSLGSRWTAALAATIGKWLLDYLSLVAALLAVGSHPRLSLVLLAFAVSGVLGMIPITPGGLGFVDAGLAAMLVLAGVPANDALLATLAYRVVSYWLPLPAGATAYGIFRRRYGRPPRPPSDELESLPPSLPPTG